ncbi:hypothetical protein EDD11_008872 [Mortierella claussenii]|nr:hypothetical protein EDD11_008872 [Mortierella claussenii]
MESTAAYKLVFLNELHDKLKRLDPRRTPNAGLYRVLGRLGEYDIERRIVKLESCFHHQHMPPIPSKRSAKSAKRHDISSSNDIIDLTLHDEDNTSQNQRDDGRFNSEQNIAGNGCVDLTAATDEDSSGDNQDDAIALSMPRKRSIKGEKAMKTKGAPQSSDINRRALELTPNTPPRKKRHFSRDEALERNNTPLERHSPPMIILWVSTALLHDQWRYEHKALFQFIGEVIYQSEHWILEARTCRCMEGLDLYAYRESILLTRELVRRQQE